MLYAPLYALALFFTNALGTLSFEHPHNHFSPRVAHHHRSEVDESKWGNSGPGHARRKHWGGPWWHPGKGNHWGGRPGGGNFPGTGGNPPGGGGWANPPGPGAGEGHTWGLTESYQGRNFYDEFTFEAIEDPTRGRVNYVNITTAIQKGLTEASAHSFILRSDSTTVLDPNGPGRDSIRMQSKKQWTTGLSILNLKHMPQACGSWPAFWMTQQVDWPTHGEIDIIEGVNDEPINFSALHTLDGCSVAPTRSMTGIVTSTNCSYLNNYNEGCGVKWDRKDVYGPPLNAMGGGWFVTERTETSVKIWFWGRNDQNIPPAVRDGSAVVCTREFGTPVAIWETSDTCDLKSKLTSLNIIINLTFCGFWAGQTPLFNRAGCPGTCVDFVNNNPSAFKDAYWDITWLKVYSAGPM